MLLHVLHGEKETMKNGFYVYQFYAGSNELKIGYVCNGRYMNTHASWSDLPQNTSGFFPIEESDGKRLFNMCMQGQLDWAKKCIEPDYLAEELKQRQANLAAYLDAERIINDVGNVLPSI